MFRNLWGDVWLWICLIHFYLAQVNNLATVSLANPVKIFINNNKDIAFNLQQEFIRIRPHMEADREAIVAGMPACVTSVANNCTYGLLRL